MGFSEMREFAPSRRVGALIIVVCAVIIAVVVFRANITLTRTSSPHIVTSTSTPSVLSETDTDNDGLPDWKEALWGFDPKNPDTNSDGVGDKDELARTEASRAQQQQNLIADATIGSSTDENLTQTDQLTRALLEQAVAFDTAGITLDSNTSLGIANNFVQSLSLSTPVTPPQASIQSLRIVDTSAESRHTYGNALGTILGGKSTTETSELMVLAEFSQTGNESVLAKLSTVKQSYDSLAQQLLQTPVPQDTASTHLALINAFLATGSTVESLGTIASDPLSSILSMRIYRAYSQQLSTAFTNTQTYLKTHTTFENSEPGYIMIMNEPSTTQK